MAEPAIVLERVSVVPPEGAEPVLRDVDLVVEEGELVARRRAHRGRASRPCSARVTGWSRTSPGARCTGDVLVDGQRHPHAPAARPRPRRRVRRPGPRSPGFVTDTVEEELAYGMEQLGLPAATMRTPGRGDPRPARHRRAARPATCARCRAASSSGSRSARCSRCTRGVLVLDEPTSALDPTAAEDVLATLTRLVHDLGVTVLRGRAPARAGGALRRPRCAVAPGRHRPCGGPPAEVLADAPVVPPIVELGRLAGWSAAAAVGARRPPARADRWRVAPAPAARRPVPRRSRREVALVLRAAASRWSVTRATSSRWPGVDLDAGGPAR